MSPIAPEFARSWLLVSAALPDLADRVAAAPTDVVVVDLEDGVPPAGKRKARAAVAALLQGRSGVAPWVRISSAGSEDWADDLAVLRAASRRPDGVLLAKADSPEDVRRTRLALDPDVPLAVMIESAAGLDRVSDIAGEPGVLRLVFGSGDFARDLSVAAGSPLLDHARCRLAVASRAAGLPGPVDGPTVSRDPDVLERDSAAAAAIGMTGRLCLRPEQVAAVDRWMSPSPADLDWAEAILNSGSDTDASAAPRMAHARAIRRRGALFGMVAEEAVAAHSMYA